KINKYFDRDRHRREILLERLIGQDSQYNQILNSYKIKNKDVISKKTYVSAKALLITISELYKQHLLSDLTPIMMASTTPLDTIQQRTLHFLKDYRLLLQNISRTTSYRLRHRGLISQVEEYQFK